MRQRLQRSVGFGKSVAAVVQNRQVTFLAAGIAYYAFVSLVPLLLLALVVASVFGGEALAERVVSAAGEILTPSGADLVRDALTSESGRGGATVVGIAGLLWGGLKVFRGLDYAFSAVYGTTGEESLLGSVRDGLIVLSAIGLGVVVVAVINALVGTFAGPLAGEIASVLSLVSLSVVFFPLYYVFPNVALDARGALPGTVFAATGWTALSAVFRVYAANADAYAAYGVLGGVLLLVTWLYVGAMVVMLGAVVNAVLAGYAEDRQLQHDRHRQTRATRAMTDDIATDGDAGSDEDDGLTADDFEADETTDERHSSSPHSSGGEDPDRADLEAEIERLREEVEDFEEEIEQRTVHRDDIESDLKRYVRKRVRRGHARGWGPYLVLLYGTVMTIGAFYLLSGGWAILAMIVVWLSTLGLYVLMVLFGAGLSLLGAPGRIRDAIGSWRS
ncbi:YihY/virulence factor BrkB family protein [Halostella sp. PRR32]|uniref:YihY/virulence factor BrkB family protein n=1 Tax=Halostella sp. PRR32 TaxID=3098147 RepID=UPI002B1E5059|nr:YihY/virulence factor BrkB family protein [Halostella sp. PRR32]